MLFLSFLIALVAAWIGFDASEKYIFLPSIPLVVALMSGWDLFRRWQLKKRFHLMLESGKEEDMTEKDVSRARQRIFATPIYFVVAIVSLIVILLQ